MWFVVHWVCDYKVHWNYTFAKIEKENKEEGRMGEGENEGEKRGWV